MPALTKKSHHSASQVEFHVKSFHLQALATNLKSLKIEGQQQRLGTAFETLVCKLSFELTPVSNQREKKNPQYLISQITKSLTFAGTAPVRCLRHTYSALSVVFIQ